MAPNNATPLLVPFPICSAGHFEGPCGASAPLPPSVRCRVSGGGTGAQTTTRTHVPRSWAGLARGGGGHDNLHQKKYTNEHRSAIPPPSAYPSKQLFKRRPCTLMSATTRWSMADVLILVRQRTRRSCEGGGRRRRRRRSFPDQVGPDSSTTRAKLHQHSVQPFSPAISASFFFGLFILACDLYRSWRRTFYPTRSTPFM